MTPEPTLQDDMAALHGIKTDLAGIIDAVITEVLLLRMDLRNMRERVSEVEGTTAELVEDTKILQKQIKESTQTTRELEDQEGCSCRNSIHIIGVPERAKGQTLDLFVEDIITKTLQPRGLSKKNSVEHAHRIPGTRLRPGAPPLPIIARLFNYRDRDVILQSTRSAPPLKFENVLISFYPNFTQKVQQKRQNFLDIKKSFGHRTLNTPCCFRQPSE